MCNTCGVMYPKTAEFYTFKNTFFQLYMCKACRAKYTQKKYKENLLKGIKRNRHYLKYPKI